MKWGKAYRALSLLLVLAMLLSVLTLASCGEGEDPLGETYMEIKNGENVVTVPYDVVRCFVKQELLAYTEAQLADESIRQLIRQDVVENLVKNHYIVRVMAKDLNLGLTEEAKSNIEQLLKLYRSADDYKLMLEQMYATDAILEEFLIVEALDTIVYDFLCDCDDRFDDSPEIILADIEASEWYAAEFLILSYDDVNHDARTKDMEDVRKTALSGKTLKEASSKIQTYYKDEHSYDLNGCFPSSAIYSDDVMRKVASLKVGEVSEVFDTYTASGSPCIMLIRRVSVTNSYIDKNFDTVKANYLVRVYDDYKNEIIKGLDVTVVDKYKNKDILDIE